MMRSVGIAGARIRRVRMMGICLRRAIGRDKVFLPRSRPQAPLPGLPRIHDRPERSERSGIRNDAINRRF